MPEAGWDVLNVVINVELVADEVCVGEVVVPLGDSVWLELSDELNEAVEDPVEEPETAVELETTVVPETAVELESTFVPETAVELESTVVPEIAVEFVVTAELDEILEGWRPNADSAA